MEIDLKMVNYDLWGTLAHVLMLYKQNLIDFEKANKICRALLEIETDVENKKFSINPTMGAQLTLESRVIEKIGNAGLSMHTARSRNDQVAVTELLYIRDQIISTIKKTKDVLGALLTLSLKYEKTIMPGYTHMQPAKPTTVGQWSLAYFFGLSRALESLKNYFDIYNNNPLGAVEGYGTSWQIDRSYTANLLGFEHVWEVPQDVISSRGFAQYNFLHCMSEICLIGGKIAQDLILFNTFEFGIIELGTNVSQRMHPVTGSSVMAQKKNPDVLELIRATSPQVNGLTNIVGNVLSGLPFAYNRDSREVKEYIDMGINKTNSMLLSLQQVISTVRFNKKRMEDLVMINYSLTTDLADNISQITGIGYRTVYKIVGEVVSSAIKENKPIKDIKAYEINQKAKEYSVEMQITDTDIQRAISIETVIKRLATSKNKYLYEEAGNIIKNLAIWIENKNKIIENAYKKTHKIAKSI